MALVQPELILNKLVCLAVIGLGTAIYLHENFAPIDRLMLIIQDLTGMIIFSKTLIYLVLVITFNGTIGIGTLLTGCLGGPFLNYFIPLTSSLLNNPIPSANRDKDKDKNHSIKDGFYLYFSVLFHNLSLL